MAKVSVRVFAVLRERLGWTEKELELMDESVKDALGQAEGRGINLLDLLTDAERDPRGSFRILVNGRDIDFLQKLETKLKDGDKVLVFPPVAGGLSRAIKG